MDFNGTPFSNKPIFTVFCQKKKLQKVFKKTPKSKSHCDLQVKGLLPHGRFIHAASPRQVALEIQSMSYLPGHYQAGARRSAAVREICQVQVQFFHLVVGTPVTPGRWEKPRFYDGRNDVNTEMMEKDLDEQVEIMRIFYWDRKCDRLG